MRTVARSKYLTSEKCADRSGGESISIANDAQLLICGEPTPTRFLRWRSRRDFRRRRAVGRLHETQFFLVPRVFCLNESFSTVSPLSTALLLRLRLYKEISTLPVPHHVDTGGSRPALSRHRLADHARCAADFFRASLDGAGAHCCRPVGSQIHAHVIHDMRGSLAMLDNLANAVSIDYDETYAVRGSSCATCIRDARYSRFDTRGEYLERAVFKRRTFSPCKRITAVGKAAVKFVTTRSP